MIDRLRRPPKTDQKAGHVLQRCNIVGFELESLEEAIDGPAGFSVESKGDPRVVTQAGSVRVRRDSTFEDLDRAVEIAQPSRQGAEVAVAVGERRRRFDGGDIGHDGFLQETSLDKLAAAQQVELGRVGWASTAAAIRSS